MHSERRFSFFIYVRILVLFVFLLVSLLLHYKEPATAEFAFSSGIIRLMAFSFLFSIFSHFLLKIPTFKFFVTYLQSIWDVLFVSVLLLFTGGINSPYSFLYLLSIMNAGLLLGRREAIYTASLCGILYGALVDFQYFGMLESIGLSSFDAQQLGEAKVFYTIFLNVMGYGLAAFITGYLAERARSSEVALEEKNVNYKELSDLNTLIVTSLDIGLLTLTADGLIRVFNPYLEHITGISQLEAYNKPFTTLFPNVSSVLKGENKIINGEIQYDLFPDNNLLLSYTMTPFIGGEGKSAGCMVSISDVTALRQMETALAKRNRMAALGELSARMAHEIRNPLASMSGAVQMLAEQIPNNACDGRLLGILLRESDRLNTLITEFLFYARPPEPKKESFSLKLLIDELILQLSADSRYNLHAIQNRVLTTLLLFADPAQMRQVFLNLLCNAADSMSKGGIITVDASIITPTAADFASKRLVSIVVEDQGEGISPESLKHLFEPFWTTKVNGTGLGLATTYRIIDVHGGTINLENRPEGGCRCIIVLSV